MVLLWLTACASDPTLQLSVLVGPDPAEAAVDQLVRASMSLRGVRPSASDVQQVHADPSQLRPIVTTYTADPRFGDTVRDMHHEHLRMRSPAVWLPAVGPLESTPESAIHEALVEAPLRLVEHVVRIGAPYTEILTADLALTSPASAAMFGLPHDPSGPEWQAVPLPADHAATGLLASPGLWVRHPSSGANHHRARAALLADALLCHDFTTGDVPIDGSVDLSSEPAVADALRTNPQCTACHDALDPLASALWNIRGVVVPGAVRTAHTRGCPEGTTNCYPLPIFLSDPELLRSDAGMPEPALFGTPVDGPATLARAIATHPDFASCTVRRFASWLAQVDAGDLDPEQVAHHTERFVAQGLDARALAVDLVLADGLTEPGRRHLRPEQAERLVQDHSGHTWTQGATAGALPLRTTDEHGYRSMSGGMDGHTVTRPTHVATPVGTLVHTAHAEAAAEAWVSAEGPWPTDPPAVRARLAELLLDVWSEPTPGPELDEATALFTALLAESGDPDRAWSLTLSALLRDPAVTHY